LERYRVKVRKKGLIVIPAEVRRRFGIREGSFLELVVEKSGMRLIVPRSLKDAFGVDGERALEVVRLISASRRLRLKKRYVLDASVLTLYFAGSKKAKEYINAVYEERIKAFICEVNAAEFFVQLC